MVFLCPEFIDPKDKRFMTLTGIVKKSVFAKWLCALVVDEAHLIYVWRNFRSEYANLSCLWTLWPDVPIMILSATMAPHVAKYVHKSLEMHRGARLIKRSINRDNIYFHREQITNASVFGDLDWIIPKAIQDISQIPKTMIFVDSLPGVCALTDYLIPRLNQQWRGHESLPTDCICDFSATLSTERREQVRELLKGNTCKIIISTEACGMGMDIGDI